MDWRTNFTSERPYDIVATSAFPASCATRTSLLLPTAAWTQKIATKYDSSYHPLLYAKSLARLPLGIGYGILGISTGAAVGVGGCLLAIEAKQGAGEIMCSASLKAAGFLVEKSTHLVNFTLQPDLRRWQKLPLAIVIVRKGQPQPTPDCYTGDVSSKLRTVLLE